MTCVLLQEYHSDYMQLIHWWPLHLPFHGLTSSPGSLIPLEMSVQKAPDFQIRASVCAVIIMFLYFNN